MENPETGRLTPSRTPAQVPAITGSHSPRQRASRGWWCLYFAPPRHDRAACARQGNRNEDLGHQHQERRLPACARRVGSPQIVTPLTPLSGPCRGRRLGDGAGSALTAREGNCGYVSCAHTPPPDLARLHKRLRQQNDTPQGPPLSLKCAQLRPPSAEPALPRKAEEVLNLAKQIVSPHQYRFQKERIRCAFLGFSSRSVTGKFKY